MIRKYISSLALAILIFTSACGTPAPQEPTPTLWTMFTATPKPSPTSITLPTSVSTTNLPMLSVRADSPCFAGPGDHYDLIANLEIGRQVEVAAKTETYWLVQYSVATQCWVADQQVNIDGDSSTIPVVTPTPKRLLPLAAPEDVILEVTCKKEQKYIDEVTLTWTDTSSAETGFRVYRDGNVVAEIPANKTQVTVTGSTTSNRIHYYYITAYNENGEIKSVEQSIFCKKFE